MAYGDVMIWFYNNEGVADGPHDEAAMRAMIKEGRIDARTLIWRSGLELWEEAGTLMAVWWQPQPARGKAAANPGAETSGTRRSPTPLAPSEEELPRRKDGFLTRLFGRKKST